MKVVVAIVLVAIALLVVFMSRGGLAGGDTIGGDRARDLVGDGAVLIDVRSPAEFASGHVDGARNIPHTELDVERLRQEGVSSPVVIYCASGRRASMAIERLQREGVEEVYNAVNMRNYQAGAR